MTDWKGIEEELRSCAVKMDKAIIKLLVDALESTCPVEVTDSAGNHLHWMCPSCLGVAFKYKPEIDEICIEHRPECLLQKALKAAREFPGEERRG